jgi:two-component system, NarL family, invasion response regulator UvrY
MIRVVVADKNETMRIGMRTLFEKHSTSFSIWEAADRTSLLNNVANHECNLVILEPLMCPGGGEALIRQVRRESPVAKVLVYSELDERKHGVRAIRCGARGYVMKSSPAADLLAAAERVSAGRMHMSQALAEEVALSAWGDKTDAPHEMLSEREKMVFSMLVCGWSVKNIASVLNVSNKTVSTHKARTLVKMRCANLSELVQYAIVKGLKEDCEALCQVW